MCTHTLLPTVTSEGVQVVLILTTTTVQGLLQYYNAFVDPLSEQCLFAAANLNVPVTSCFSSPPQGESPQIEHTLSHVVRSASIISEVQGAFVQCALGVTITVFAGLFCPSFGPMFFWL